MQIPDIPEDEESRLQSLQALQVLDTSSEDAFDSLVKAAAAVCGTPISLISLVDADRQWFKANFGLEEVSETPRDISICGHTINQNHILEIEDLHADAMFADNPLVTDTPHMRFYAGVPLRMSDGATVGTLCVVGRRPKKLTPYQNEVLAHLATVAITLLEGRRAMFAERAHYAAAARSEIVLDQSLDAIVVYDINGNVVQWNAAAENLFGYTAAEMNGKFIGRIIPESKNDETLNLKKQVEQSHEGIRAETTRLHKNGTEFDVSVTVAPIIDAHQQINGYVSTTTDISERIKTAAQLQKSEAKFRELTSNLPVGVFSSDQTGRCIYTNPRWQQIYGLADGENWKDSVHPDDRQLVEKAEKACLESGQTLDISYRVMRPDGEIREVSAQAHPSFDINQKITGLIGSVEDETKRRKTENALATAHQRMNMAAEAGGIGVFEFDPYTGLTNGDVRLNELYGLSSIRGWHANELWQNQVHPEDRSAVAALKNSFADPAIENTPQADYRVIWDDGSMHHLRGAARIHRDHEGKPIKVIGVVWDVSETYQLTAELAKQHKLSQITLESIGDAVITTDAHGVVTWLNPVAEQMTGYEVDHATGRSLADVFRLVDETSRMRLRNSVEDCLQTGSVVNMNNQAILISSDGSEYGIEDTAAPIKSESGELYGTVLAFRDVTQRRKLVREMQYRATHDPLTNLLNREEFEHCLQDCMDLTKSDLRTHALLFIDLDQFKLINDACGHAGGDRFLQQVAKILRNTIRSGDILARLGGDEFGVILENCKPEQANKLAQKICRLLDQSRFQHEEKSFRVGASIGLVVVDDRWTGINSLMQAADTSCFAAKDAGRNRVHQWYDTDNTLQTRQGEMQWANRLERALDENRFVLFAQRIFATNDVGQNVAAEVLLRMQDEQGELVLPGAFLPAAERFHLSSRVDRWVINQVLLILIDDQNWRKISRLSINISGQSIGDRDFHSDILSMLTNAGKEICQKLCFEITETAAVTNISEASNFIAQVKKLGVSMALDDFGAGASSFGYLKSMPVNFLKIDGQFVQTLNENPLDDVAVRCFVDVAKVVGVDTVAEYVDRPEVLERLKEIDVDYVQGFLLHEPEPMEVLFGEPDLPQQLAKIPA